MLGIAHLFSYSLKVDMKMQKDGQQTLITIANSRT